MGTQRWTALVLGAGVALLVGCAGGPTAPVTPPLPPPGWGTEPAADAQSGRELLDRAQPAPGGGWLLAGADGDGAAWNAATGELRLVLDAEPFIQAGLQAAALPGDGWRVELPQPDAHGHIVDPPRLYRLEAVGSSPDAGPDAVAELEALAARRPGAASESGRAVRFAAGDGFTWDENRLRLQLAAAPLQAAGLDPTGVAGWRSVPAAGAQPALLEKAIAFN